MTNHQTTMPRILLSALLTITALPLAAQRPGARPAAPAARSTAAPPSPYRIGEIRLMKYNVGHQLTDSTGKALPPYTSPIQGFLEPEEWGYVGRGAYLVPLVLMVEILGAANAADDPRPLTLTMTATQQFAGEGPKTKVAGPEPIALGSVWATGMGADEFADRRKLTRTWVPFIYYVRVDCYQYDFTASIRAGSTGPALVQQSASFFVPFECH